MTHDLYIVRHAEAIPRGTLSPDDHRWLLPKGRRAFYRAARRLSRRLKKGQIQAILTSPLPRAVMTAELLARALRLRGPVEVYAELSPDGSIEAVASLLTGQDRCVAVVGHQPMLGTLLGTFLHPPPKGDGDDNLDLAKGAIAALRPDDQGRARLRFLIEP